MDWVLGHKCSTVLENVVDSLALAQREDNFEKMSVETQKHPKLMK